MTDKLRAAAQAALLALDSDHPDIQIRAAMNLRRAAMNLRAALAEPAIKDSLTVAEQEPVACIKTNGELMWLKKPSTIYSKPRPLYTAPPRREWVGLTDDEIKKVANSCVWSEAYHVDFSRAIETKLQEKNT